MIKALKSTKTQLNILIVPRVRVRSPIRNPTMDVAGFPNRFCILLDFWVGLATTGHIRSLMIFSVHVLSFVFLLSKYTNSIKVSNQIKIKSIIVKMEIRPPIRV